MAIEIFNYDGSLLTTLQDGTIDVSTSTLNLVGRGYKGWGKPIQQDLLWIMQNFAGTQEPANPVIGQLWYDTSANTNILRVWNGTIWSESSDVVTQNSAPPSGANVGALWYDTNNLQLHAWNGTTWDIVGPLGSNINADPLNPGVPDHSVIDAISVRASEDGSLHQVWRVTIGGTLLAVISKDQAFTPAGGILISNGFTKIQPGINFSLNVANAGLSGANMVQSLVPNSDLAYNIGSSSYRVNNIYTGSLTSSKNITADSASFGNIVTFSTGTTAYPPAIWQAGTLSTSPQAGAIEFDGNNFYITTLISSVPTRQTIISNLTEGTFVNPLLPTVDNILNVGSPTHRWNTIYGSLVGSSSTVTTSVSGTTTTSILNASTGNITSLTAGVTTANTLNASTGNITSLTAGTTTTSILNVSTGNITSLTAGTTTTSILNVSTGNITSLTAGTTTTSILNASTGNIIVLSSSTILAGTTTTSTLNASTGNITSLTSPTILAGTTTTSTLNASTGNITSLTSPTILAGTSNVSVLNASSGNITSLTTTTSNSGSYSASGTIASTQDDTTVATTNWVRNYGGFQAQVVLTSGTSSTGIIPTGIQKIKVTVVGGGGAGGGSGATIGMAGSGGGSGGVSTKYYTGALSGLTYTYTVGAGGSGSSGAAGGNGGSSSFTLNSITVTASGGAGGTAGTVVSTNYGGGSGATAGSGGDMNLVGGYGSSSIGTAAAATCMGGQGGSTIFGGAGRGGTNNAGSSAGGTNTGAGGGGAVSTSNAAVAGSNGGSGIIIIEY